MGQVKTVQLELCREDGQHETHGLRAQRRTDLVVGKTVYWDVPSQS